jgi:hypothetical protein
MPRSAFGALLAAATLAAAQTSGPAVTGLVFLDRNGNGARDAGEPPLPDVVVSNQLAAVKTGADGRFSLDGPGHGVVFVSVPRGHRPVGRPWRRAGEPADFPLAPAPDAESFSFVHASDTHISDESLPRVRRLGEILAERRPEFVLVSGDLVKDALRVPEAEATRYYEMYTREIGRFPVPVWSGPGNHENFGIERHLSLVSREHPLYGKQMYRKHLGPNYYSFNWGRVHFVALDTVDVDDLRYYGHVDAVQLRWLEQDLGHLRPGTTVVTFNHIPLATARLAASAYDEDSVAPSLIKVGGKNQYRHVVSNAGDVLARLRVFRHTLALGGHFHGFERLLLQPGGDATRFHMAAAVVGPNNSGVASSPSGVTLYRVAGDAIDDGEFVPLDR